MDDVVVPVLVAAIITMTAAQLLDLATFMAMVDRLGPGAEANPLVARIFATHGLPLVAIVKVTLLAFTTGILAVLARRPGRAGIIAAVVATGILVGLFGGLSNLVAIRAI